MEQLVDRWPVERYSVGSYTMEQILHYVDNPEWQKFRSKVLKGAPTKYKLKLLVLWLQDHPEVDDKKVWVAHVQVSNYLNALKRGGLLDTNLRVQR